MQVLDFEKPVLELERELEKLHTKPVAQHIDLSAEISMMEAKPYLTDSNPEAKYRAVIRSRDKAVFGVAALELRRWMEMRDQQRPIYHTMGPMGFTFDVNGPIHHDGRYPSTNEHHTMTTNTLHRSIFICLVATAWFVTSGAGLLAAEAPAGFKLDPAQNIIPAPKNPAEWPAFREALVAWREEARTRLNYSDALYQRPEFAWSTANYSCCFLMTCDETFYDRKTGRYTVDAFLDHGRQEFGGYDSVVLWHAYPRIGLDERNQFDFYRDLPGGLSGVRGVVEQFHRRGVRAYIDYNPWDTGTRREGQPDVDALVELVRALAVDGIFLDTMDKGAAEFRGKLDAVRPGVILESEIALPLESIHDHHASWAQWFGDSETPGVLRNKWLEPRHMQHQIKRWDIDHSGELHTAWMNGSGMMVWENVFGSWVPWNPRDRSILRAMLPIQRRFTRLFNGEAWTPLVATEQPGVYASLWQGGGLRLWTLVNRRQEGISGPLLRIPSQPGQRCFDLVAGRAAEQKADGTSLIVSGSLPPRGIGCFLAGADQNLGADLPQFLTQQAGLNARAVADASTPRRETRLLVPAAAASRPQLPAGMVGIPAATLTLTIEMRAREGGFYDSQPPAGENYDPGRRPKQKIQRPVTLRRFAMDETLVSNAQFAEFLKASGYKPEHPENFLKHWTNGIPPAGREDHPVVYVDLDVARAYARWAGK
ncbi:MAG: SUMF1/EgtB/PvdO family nonheme iron enzyme, partial [Verrucomicrobia bacterium]|nr:SUMF1/EgtB/PvdO family nonheme iron enzyme [Verrucomicrobiota bacterium]